MPSDEVLIEEIAKYAASGYPNAPAASELPLTVAVWHEVLADLTDGEVREACRRHRRSDDPGDRFWPIPARIRALSAPGRLAASLGTDADQAWHDFYRRLRSLFPHGPGKGMPLDEDDARDLAMAAGLRAIGGTSKVRDMTDEDRERFAAPKWKAAYVAERRRQAGEPREVRAMLVAMEGPKMLESGK